MPLDDFLDPAQEQRKIKKAQQRSFVHAGGGGDSSHAGSGANSVALGPHATATGSYSTALGGYALALNDYATALGMFCEARATNASAFGVDSVAQLGEDLALGNVALANGRASTAIGDHASATEWKSVAIGQFADAGHQRAVALGQGASTTANNQIMLGTSSDTVVVPGTFSNPSARKLKTNITPAPRLVDVFPVRFEWEYIDGDGRRQIGPMADDLVGTDAEPFLIRDDAGEPAGIDKLGLYGAQIAALLERLVSAEARITVLEEELRSKNG